MDFFGALVLAGVCALGGGSLRDLLIGATPVFWAADPSYLTIILLTTLVAIIGVQRIPTGKGIRLLILDVADAVGLALFAVLGAQKALQFGLAEPVAVVMGVITGVAGGMIRDVLCREVPLILRGEVYASAAIVGVVVYTVLRLYFDEVIAILVGMGVVIAIRLLALFFGVRFPDFKKNIG